MNRTDVASLLGRDWELVQRLKTDFWIHQSARLTPSGALRLGEELRLYVRAVRTDWPDGAEREADLACHARVSETLRHATTHGSR